MTEPSESGARADTRDAAFNAVVEAAELARRCDGYWHDRRDQAAGWQVHHAVDADIIAMYSRPSLVLQYARIFAAQEGQAGEQRLAELLGRFALLTLAGLGGADGTSGSLILIPPHDDEYDRVRLAIVQQAMAQAHSAADDLPALLDAIADGLQDDPQALSRAVDGLIERFGHVVEAFDGQSGPLRQLKRLSVLGKRLINLYRAAPYLSPRREERLLPLVDGRDAPDRAAHFELVRQWRSRLERHRPRSKPDRAVLGDATALATLQMVNERAKPLRQRLVLITGSENVFAAASEAEVLDGGTVTSFDRAYLRHPQAFIGAKDFFERTPPQAEAEHDKHHARLRIVDWLNLFFPKVLLQTRPSEGPAVAAAGMSHDADVRVDHERLNAIIRRDDPWLNASLGTLARENYRRLTHREFPDGLLEDFALQIEQIATDLGVSTEDDRLSGFRAERFIDEINQRLRSGFTVSQLQAELTDRIEDTVIKLYLETGELGVMQLLGNGDPVRGVPALRFEKRYAAAQAQSEKLCLALWRDDDERSFDLGAAYTALDNDGDREHYHAHLIHAQVYAARGHWFATRTLSRLALRVSDRIPEDDKNGRHGREAAYFMAVAERRLAKKPEDLQRAAEALDKAKARETPDRPTDPRFLAEDMAREVTALQFQRFLPQALSSYPVAKVLATAAAVMAQVSADDPVSVRSWVRRQTTTNAALVALLAEIDGVDAPDAGQRAALLALLDAMRREGLAPDSPPDADGIVYSDGLSSFVYDVATATFATDEEQRRAAALRVAQDAPMGLGTPPFEHARKALFRDFVARRQATHGGG